MPNPTDKEAIDDDNVGVRAPDLSEDAEDAAKGDEQIDPDDEDDMDAENLDDGILQNDRGLDG